MMRRVKHVLGDTKRAILAAGALAGAVLAMYGVGKMILSNENEPDPTPLTSEAPFLDAKVEPNILLEEYEYRNQSAVFESETPSTPNSQAPSGPAMRMIVYEGPTGASDTAVEPASSANSGGCKSAASPGETGKGVSGKSGVETTPEETKQEREEKLEAKEEAKKKAEEECEVRAKKEAEAREREAKEKRENELKEKAKEEAEARAQIAKERRERKPRQERERKQREKHPSGKPGSSSSHGHGGKTSEPPEHFTFVKPPPPAIPFHHEGKARVLVGTGAPTDQVDEVLSKAKAILAEQHVGAGSSGATNANPINTSLVATFGDAKPLALPSHCGLSCAIRPTIDQAIADYSSNLVEAARKVATAFADSRVQIFDHKDQPIGVTVYYTIHFRGDAGDQAVVVWSLCSTSTGRPLPRTWWRNVIVKRIDPESNDIDVPGSFWAPIPTESGDYQFKLKVLVGSSYKELSHGETDIFH